jgi:hypothetical protein
MTRRSGGAPRRAPASATQRSREAPPAPVATPAPLDLRARAGVIAGLVVLWLALSLPVLGGRTTFVRGDAGRYTVFAEFSRERFAATGERTFWNPYVVLGLPTVGSLADPRPQWLPAPLLHAWDALTRTDAGTPLWLPLLACLGGALAAAWLVRALWGCGPFAMALGGGLWLLAPGIVVPLAFGHDAQCVTTALMPLSLLAAHAVLVARTARAQLAASLGLALALAAQVLGGHPQFVVYTGLVLVPFAIERALAFGRAPRLWAIAAAGALGAAMSAGFWLPALAFAAHAQRAEAGFAAREAAIWSALPRDLLSLAWPRAVGYGDAAYWGGLRGTDFSHVLGILACVLAGAGLVARAPARRAARLWGVVALAGMLLALGRNLPVLGGLFQSLPVIGAFRTPVSWLTLTVLALALLAARGLDAVLTSERRAWWGRAAIGSAAAGGLVLLGRDAVAASWLAAAQPAVVDRIARGLANQRILQRFVEAAPAAATAAATDLGLELLLVGVALGALAWARRDGAERWRPLANGLVTLAALLPCLTIVAPQLRAAAGPRASLRTQPAPALARAAAADPLHRAAWFEHEWALSQRWSLSDDWVAWRARQVLGLSGAIPADWDFVARSGLFASRAFLRACAVRHVAMPGGGDDTVGTWPDALPRAYFVQRSGDIMEDVGPTHPGDHDRDLAASLKHPTWDPAVDAFADRGPARQYVFLDADSLRWERDDPDRLALRVQAASDAFVVVADAFFPGWTARMDGRVVPIYRVDLLLRGVYVPPGAHELTFDYVPEGWALARGLALAGWLAALALGFVAWRGVPALKPEAARSPASSAAPSGDAR